MIELSFLGPFVPWNIRSRGAPDPDPDPDPDPARYPVNFVDPVRVRLDPQCLDPAGIRIRTGSKISGSGSTRILLKHHKQ